MSKKVTKERCIEVMRNGSEKDAERLCYDILNDDIDEIIPHNPFAILAAEDKRFAKHLGMTYEEFLELKKKLYG